MFTLSHSLDWRCYLCLKILHLPNDDRSLRGKWGNDSSNTFSGCKTAALFIKNPTWDAAWEDGTVLRGLLVRIWRSPQNRCKAVSERSTKGLWSGTQSHPDPLGHFMPYHNQPVVGEGPFDVIVAFRLELNVVHTARLQTNAGVTSPEKDSPHTTWSEPLLTAGPDQDGNFAAPP